MNDNNMVVNLSSCVSMIIMRLDNNTLGRPTLAELGEKLTSLASLANLSNPEFLDVACNKLTASMRHGFDSIKGMWYFNLAEILFNGILPPSL